LKVSKTTRWILTIGILAILLVGLGVNYSRQKTEQSELTANIAQAQQELIRLIEYTKQRNDLETRLSQANSRLASVKEEFHKPTQSVEISDVLFQAANDANVTITGLSSSTPASEKINDIDFRVFSLSISAEGEVKALLNFMANLGNRFPNSSINSASISVSQGTGSLSLSLKIYAYENK